MRNRLIHRALFVCLTVLAASTPPGSARTIRTGQCVITAPEFTYDVAAGTITTVGRSRVTSERLELECGGLTATFDSKGEKLLHLEAGGQVRFIARQVVKDQLQRVEGSAETARLDNVKQELQLTGGSELTVGNVEAPVARLTADTILFRLTADRNNVVADGHPKLVWRDATATARRIEGDLTPGHDDFVEARLTGGVVLTGTMVERENGQPKGKIISRRPVRAEGQEAVWTQKNATAVLRGAAKVDLGRTTGKAAGGRTKQLETAHLTGEEIVIELQPRPTIHVKSKGPNTQSKVSVTTRSAETDSSARRKTPPAPPQKPKPE